MPQKRELGVGALRREERELLLGRLACGASNSRVAQFVRRARIGRRDLEFDLAGLEARQYRLPGFDASPG